MQSEEAADRATLGIFGAVIAGALFVGAFYTFVVDRGGTKTATVPLDVMIDELHETLSALEEDKELKKLGVEFKEAILDLITVRSEGVSGGGQAVLIGGTGRSETESMRISVTVTVPPKTISRRATSLAEEIANNIKHAYAAAGTRFDVSEFSLSYSFSVADNRQLGATVGSSQLRLEASDESRSGLTVIFWSPR